MKLHLNIQVPTRHKRGGTWHDDYRLGVVDDHRRALNSVPSPEFVK